MSEVKRYYKSIDGFQEVYPFHNLGRIQKYVKDEDYVALEARLKVAEAKIAALREAINKIGEVASGECQVAMNDTQGMEWIPDYAKAKAARQMAGQQCAAQVVDCDCDICEQQFANEVKAG